MIFKVGDLVTVRGWPHSYPVLEVTDAPGSGQVVLVGGWWYTSEKLILALPHEALSPSVRWVDQMRE